MEEEKEIKEQEEVKEIKKTHGGKIGGALGALAGSLGTILANPLGRWMVFTAQDEAGLSVHHFVEDLFKSRKAGDSAYRVFNIITNTIMAYPAILPIVGGLIAAGIGALVGKKISKSKLKHQSLQVKNKTMVKER